MNEDKYAIPDFLNNYDEDHEPVTFVLNDRQYMYWSLLIINGKGSLCERKEDDNMPLMMSYKLRNYMLSHVL